MSLGRPTGPDHVSRLEHARYRRHVDAYVAGRLQGGLLARMAHHVATCSACRKDPRLADLPENPPSR